MSRQTWEEAVVWWATRQARAHTCSWKAYCQLVDRLLASKGVKS